MVNVCVQLVMPPVANKEQRLRQAAAPGTRNLACQTRTAWLGALLVRAAASQRGSVTQRPDPLAGARSRSPRRAPPLLLLALSGAPRQQTVDALCMASRRWWRKPDASCTLGQAAPLPFQHLSKRSQSPRSTPCGVAVGARRFCHQVFFIVLRRCAAEILLMGAA
jgi:hypothetical protein